VSERSEGLANVAKRQHGVTRLLARAVRQIRIVSAGAGACGVRPTTIGWAPKCLWASSTLDTSWLLGLGQDAARVALPRRAYPQKTARTPGLGAKLAAAQLGWSW